MKLLKEIIEQWGFVTAEQCAELAQYFPRTELIIQWGAMPRQPMKAINVAKRIKEVEDSDQDYVRQVFIKSESMKKLREALGEEAL
jgi:hypothetical protein